MGMHCIRRPVPPVHRHAGRATRQTKRGPAKPRQHCWQEGLGIVKGSIVALLAQAQSISHHRTTGQSPLT